MFLGCSIHPSVCPILMIDISQEHQEGSTFGTNIDQDTMVNQLDSCGQRSKVTVTT